MKMKRIYYLLVRVILILFMIIKHGNEFQCLQVSENKLVL